ncbi:hypothetical protein GGX14DRAFT_410535 [Mycena pura]|uniref:Uncharacterized protein n=1 Tax=Mycena pura TaxID=153505 RepID=A0AAD7E6N3_9AGAR|nr:hypothetical protein GGX14DRAFT_410535 [Mycena pura]
MASDTGLGIASEAIRIVVEPNTFVVIGGTALGGYTQRLTVLRGADQWQLTGQDRVLTNDNTNYLSFQPVNKKEAYIFLFEAAKSGSDFMDSEYARDFKATKHVVPNFATYYTIHTEDGGDTDFHDITLTVALIGASKDGNPPTGEVAVDPPTTNETAQPDEEETPSNAGASERPNVVVSTTGSNSNVSVTTDGINKPNVSVTTQGPSPSTISINTGGSGNPNVSVVTTGTGSVSVGVDAAGQVIPTGAFILRNVFTNCDMTAVIDTSPVMMFLGGQVPVEWRTWNVEIDGSGRVSISNKVKAHRYLQEGGTLVETTTPSPVRLIRALTENQERYYISTDSSVNPANVLYDPNPVGVPAGKLQTNALEINVPQQLWTLVPVS